MNNVILYVVAVGTLIILFSIALFYNPKSRK